MRRIWRQRGLAALLLPVAFVFYLLSALRRALYRLRIFKTYRLAVPVVVVGNIAVGGSGKTPLIIHLAQRLQSAGYMPGIVSRGYGSDQGNAREVFADSHVDQVGDEALLLKQRSGAPVFVGHSRVEAGRALLAAYPQCQMILCDDGLQHYALQRDLEIAVIDRRGFMNGWLLPAGPLRESGRRLMHVDACVLHDSSVAVAAEVPVFRMQLVGDCFYALDDVSQRCDASALRHLRLAAFAGIGEPQRFFEQLARLGLVVEQHAFADHHQYRAEDFAVTADAILTTEKDAVKFADFLPQLQCPVWVLPVDAVVEPDLPGFILEKLDGRAPA